MCILPRNLRANTRLAKANRENSWTLFFARLAIARLAMLEQALHDMEAMLDLRAHAGFRLLQLFLGPAQWIFLERLKHAWPLPGSSAAAIRSARRRLARRLRVPREAGT